MKTSTKQQLAQFSLTVIVVVSFGLVVAMSAWILMATFDWQPFRAKPAAFLGMSFAAAIALAVGSLILNVAANLSLIADAKAQDMRLESSGTLYKRWIAGLLLTSFLVCALIAAGDALSKRRWKSVLEAQVDSILGAQRPIIDKISTGLSAPDYQAVASHLQFLESQRRDLPAVSAIFAGSYQGQKTLHSLHGWQKDNAELAKKGYQPRYYECSKEIDCEYLERFFGGQAPKRLSHVKESEYALYVPVEGPGVRAVLIFAKMERYGKFGS